MNTPATVTVTGATRDFHGSPALRGVDLVLPPGRITGLLGRNGAGKSTLLSLLAGRRRPTSGTIRVDDGDPFTDAATIQRICLVGDGGGDSDTSRVGARIDLLTTLRPSFDPDLAHRLLADFDIAERTRIKSLSRGQRAAVAVTLGLASRCALTLFDESHLGMDAHNRYVFYDALLADYVAHPRTIVVSTHHVDELARVLEDVVVLDVGRVLLHEPRDEVVARGAVVTGPARAVSGLVAGTRTLRTRRLGNTTEAVVYGDGTADVRQRAPAAGVDVTPIGLQDLFVQLTMKEHA